MVIRGFAFDEVKITEPVLVNAQEKEQEYLLSLDPDRLMAGFRETAGLPKRADRYPGGWENSELSGHTLGHYMVAMAQLYATNRSEDVRERLEYVIEELSACQAGRGYLFASNEEIFDRLEEGGLAWMPWYTMHKLLTGLLAVYRLANMPKALKIAKKLGAWVCERVLDWTDKERRKVLCIADGGMNDCLYKLYKETHEKVYLEAAEQFEEKDLFEKLAAGKDVLPNKHANNTIPKFLGALNRYMMLGDSEKLYLDAAKNFFDIVVNDHTYITGGNGELEHFRAPGALGGDRTQCNCETCSSFNMLKLAERLFTVTGEKKYMDYYERTFFNAMLGAQNPETGMTAFYQPMEPGHFKAYGTPHASFWCCTGTGMESFTKLGKAMYHKLEDRVYVNRYVASELNAKDFGMTLTQTVSMEAFDKASIGVKMEEPKQFAICLRIPEWSANTAEVTVNGKNIECDTEDGYLVLDRTWESGDTIELTLFPKVVMHPLKDLQHCAAATYGPYVLAAGLGKVEMVTERMRNKVIVSTKNVPVRDRIVLNDDLHLQEWFENSGENFKKNDGELTFTLQGTDVDGEMVFEPYYKKYDERYGVYFEYHDVDNLPPDLRAILEEQKRVAEELRKAEEERLRLEAEAEAERRRLEAEAAAERQRMEAAAAAERLRKEEEEVERKRLEEEERKRREVEETARLAAEAARLAEEERLRKEEEERMAAEAARLAEEERLRKEEEERLAAEAARLAEEERLRKEEEERLAAEEAARLAEEERLRREEEERLAAEEAARLAEEERLRKEAEEAERLRLEEEERKRKEAEEAERRRLEEEERLRREAEEAERLRLEEEAEQQRKIEEEAKRIAAQKVADAERAAEVAEANAREEAAKAKQEEMALQAAKMAQERAEAEAAMLKAQEEVEATKAAKAEDLARQVKANKKAGKSNKKAAKKKKRYRRYHDFSGVKVFAWIVGVLALIVALYWFATPISKAFFTGKDAVDTFLADKLPKVAEFLNIKGNGEEMPIFKDKEGTVYLVEDADEFVKNTAWPQGYQASVVRMNGKQYICIEGNNLKMYYLNEIAETDSKHVYLENGTEKAMYFREYSFENAETLCPSYGVFNKAGVKQYLFDLPGEGETPFILDAKSLDEHKILLDEETAAKILNVEAYLEENDVIRVNLTAGEDAYAFAVPKKTGAVLPDGYKVGLAGFEYIVGEDGIRFEADATSADSYLGKVAGNLDYAAGAYTVEEYAFYGFAGEEYSKKDGETVYKALDAAGAEGNFTEAPGENGERLLVPFLTGVKAYEYDRASFVTAENGEISYVRDGKTVSLKGIDISRKDGTVDWDKVAESGVDYAMIRMGIRGDEAKGKCQVDANYTKNVKAAVKAGLDVGVYFTSRATTVDEAKEEAQFVIKNIKDYDVTWPVAVDTVEAVGAEASRASGLSVEERTACIKTFMEEIEKAGYTPVLYADARWSAFKFDLTELSEYDMWYSSKGEVADYPYHHTMWEYLEGAEVPGVEGTVDVSLSFVDYGAAKKQE